MSAFDYLSVLISIVLGLSITQLLGGFAAMVRARDRLTLYWPLLMQMCGLFILNVQVWWALFGLRWMRDWTFAAFFIVLLQPVTLYLMSAFLTPDIPAKEAVDLRAFYFREKRWFFGAALSTLLVSLTKDVFVTHGTSVADFAAHGIFIAMALAGFFSRSDWMQKLLAILFMVFYVTYIGLLFVQLPG